MLLSLCQLIVVALSEIPPIPDRVLAAYPDWGMCGGVVDDAIDRGVNVIIWFAANLIGGADPRVEVDLDLECVKKRILQYPNVVHLMSIGGWNAPHVNELSGQEWFNIWTSWNEEIGFHGIDWDLEGNDSPSSPENTFSLHTLKVMEDFTKSAVSKKFYVAMAPPQSYLDPQNSEFSRSLQHSPDWQESFSYHGSNVYGYLIATCGVDSFAFIAVQLYEGWSRTGRDLSNILDSSDPQQVANYLHKVTKSYHSGWTINFSSDPSVSIPTQTISIPPSKLVLGVANFWAEPPPSKFVFIEPTALRKIPQNAFRGFMFWCLKHEGDGGYYFSMLLNDNSEKEL